MIVKTIAESPSLEDAARVAGQEFAALTWLRARVDARLRETIPEPLAWIPGSPAVAMRKLDGITVGRLLQRHGTRLAVWGAPVLERTGADIGRWLRAMHDATRAQAAPLQGERILGQIDGSLDTAVAHGLPVETASRIRAQAALAVGRLARSRVPHAARQGNFTVSNILVDGSSVRIVDFENFDAFDAVFEDVASFAAHLRVLSNGPLYSRTRIAGMRRAFLRAYGQSDDDPVLTLFELKHSLAVLADSPGVSIVSGWRRHVLAREATELTRRLGIGVVRYPASLHPRRAAASGDRSPRAEARLEPFGQLPRIRHRELTAAPGIAECGAPARDGKPLNG